MRILQLVQKPQRRGAEVFAFQLSAWLRRQAHDVRTIYLYPYDGHSPLEIRPGDSMAMGNEGSVLERVPGVHPALLFRVRHELSRFTPDVVQANGARTIRYGAALARLDPKRKWRLIYRNIDSPVFWVKGRLREHYYRRVVMPQVDGVVGVSETTLAEVRRFYQLRAPSVFVPNGVDLKALEAKTTREIVREKWTTPVSATLLLFIGNLGRQKRPDRFLRVVSDVCRRRDDVFAWLLGDGPEREASERLAADLGIADRVRFLGYQDDIASFVAAGDVYVSCSDTDGIPAVVIEAGYLGLPTVAFRVGGMHECVRDGETGTLVPSGDEEALVSAILSLVDSPSRRDDWGGAARRWVSGRFSMDAVGHQDQTFYRQLIAANMSPSIPSYAAAVEEAR